MVDAVRKDSDGGALSPSNEAFRLVNAAPRHVADIARLHKACIDRSFLSELGEGFLRRLYDAMLRYESAGLIVCLNGAGETVGFTSVTDSTRRMNRWIMLREWWRLGLPLALKMTRWSRVKQVIENLFYAGRKQPVELPEAELLSIAVDSRFRRHGLGRKLLLGRLGWLADRDVKYARVFCTEGLKSNPMYVSMGFNLVKQSVHHGRKTNVYVCEVEDILRRYGRETVTDG